MKSTLSIFSAVIVLFCMTTSCKSQTKKSNNILVAYYSWSENHNTKTVAEQIAQLTGADLFVITPVIPYSTDFKECVDIAREEQKTDARPSLAFKVENMYKYDVIYLGFPNWCSSFPMIIASFVDENNLEGKTIYPFITHGSGGRQNCFTDLEKILPKANIKEGYSDYGADVLSNNSKENVKKWVEGHK